MLDINFIRENPEKVRKGIKDKGYDPKMVDDFLREDKEWRLIVQEAQKLERARREASDPKERRQYNPEVISEARKILKCSGGLNHAKIIKEALKQLRLKEKSKREGGTEDLLRKIPNLPLEDVPVGKGEEDNVVIKIWGKPTKFDFKSKDHLELGKSLGILDFETGAKVAGSGFYFWYREGALLELALVQYAFEILAKEGFTPVITPDLARSRFYLGTGYLPKGDEAQTYALEGEDLGLIATAEVTLAGKHADEVIDYKNLPLKYVGYSHCFRQESGAYGQYSRGLFRVHQFTKVEMFVYCLPEESSQWHKKILETEEKLYQGLGLPYRIMEMCTGDLGAMAAKKYDLDVWMPSRDGYGEVTSTSNCTDYQARNLNIRFKGKDNKLAYPHMLNGTAIATSRTPLAIIENYQQKDGSVVIPEVLRKYLGKDKISPKR